MFSEQGFPRGFQIRFELFRLTRSHLINAKAKYVIPSGARDLTNVVRGRAGETTSSVTCEVLRRLPRLRMTTLFVR